MNSYYHVNISALSSLCLQVGLKNLPTIDLYDKFLSMLSELMI
jgi:hypothetical protein